MKHLVFLDEKLQCVTAGKYPVRGLDLANNAQEFIFRLALRSPRLLQVLHVLDHFDQSSDRFKLVRQLLKRKQVVVIIRFLDGRRCLFLLLLLFFDIILSGLSDSTVLSMISSTLA